MELIDSYYRHTAQAPLAAPSLVGDIRVDVCVIGGGIAGCSTALHLAQRGFKVALLEAHSVGWGASGRNGGQILPGYSCGQDTLQAAVGIELAKRMWNISLEGVRLVRALIERYNIDCDLGVGHVEAALSPLQRDELLKSQRALQQDYEYHDLQMLERDELQSFVASPLYRAGLFDRGALHLHPLNYTLGMARAARDTGVRIHEDTPVTRLDTGTQTRVHTPHGSVVAEFIVLCCNAYIGSLAARPQSRIMAVGTYMVATEPLGDSTIAAVLPKNVAVSDAKFILDYFRRTPDTRLLFGGRVSYSGLHASAAHGTERLMHKVFPQLRTAKVDFAWGCYIDITMNRAPDFGRIAPNVYYLQGFSGHGVALAGVAGQLAAEAVAGHAERFDWFSNIPHRKFPGGPLRMPTLVLAMLWYRLRDILRR